MWLPAPRLTTSSVNVPAPGCGEPGQLSKPSPSIPGHEQAAEHHPWSKPCQPQGSQPPPASTRGVQMWEQADALTPQQGSSRTDGCSGYRPPPDERERAKPPAGSAGRARCQRAGTGLEEQPAPGFAAGDRKSALASVIRGRRGIARAPPGTGDTNGQC